MVGGIGVLAVYVGLIAHHEHHPKPDMPYMGINLKKMPWGDGKTGLFDQVTMIMTRRRFDIQNISLR